MMEAPGAGDSILVAGGESYYAFQPTGGTAELTLTPCACGCWERSASIGHLNTQAHVRTHIHACARARHCDLLGEATSFSS